MLSWRNDLQHLGALDEEMQRRGGLHALEEGGELALVAYM